MDGGFMLILHLIFLQCEETKFTIASKISGGNTDVKELNAGVLGVFRRAKGQSLSTCFC